MPTHEPQGCLSVIFKLLNAGKSPAPEKGPDYPFRKKDYLLTRAERSFYGVLAQAVDGRYLIFAKPRLADLLYVEKGTDSRQSHFNRIQSKHVDFVLCDPDRVSPLLVIELDDKSHNSE